MKLKRITAALLCALMLALPANEATAYLLYCNAALLFGNLLPVLPLDGGRMIYDTLARSHDAPLCETVCLRCAVIALSLLLYPVRLSRLSRIPALP